MGVFDTPATIAESTGAIERDRDQGEEAGSAPAGSAPGDGAKDFGSLPAGLRPQPPPALQTESRLIRLARELAMDMRGVDLILADYAVGMAEWDSLARNPWFQSILAAELQQWNTATSTHERVRMKSAVLVEEWLEEANRRLRDNNETLNAKVELFKTLARIANLGTNEGEGSGGGFRVVINIGNHHQVTRQIRPAAAVEEIEGEAISAPATTVEGTVIPERPAVTEGTSIADMERAERLTIRMGGQEARSAQRDRDQGEEARRTMNEGMVRPALTAVPGSPRHGQVIPRELSAAALRGRR